MQDEIKTNCHRLDTVMSKYNIDTVDIIWMDLQGAELLALKGLADKLKYVQYMHVEISHKEMYTGQVLFNELNSYILAHGFNIKNSLSMKGWQEDVIYETSRFDIVIPVGPNDISVIENQITYTKKNVIGYRNIYIIHCDPTIKIEGCIIIPESIFPFSIQTVADYHGKLERNGWYLQQLLKLYAGFVIPDILSKYLVIDSDTFFLKPTTFIQDGKCLYNYGREYHIPYFIHMQKLHNTFIKRANVSGICHHMIFETAYVKEIFDLIEKTHNEQFYKVFLKQVTETSGSGASEYEMYFNYILQRHLNDITIRALNWRNTNTLQVNNDFDYISYHWYMR